MIIRLIGNVKFPLTLDPTVWIFDDRKISFEHAFNRQEKLETEEEGWKKTYEAWDREVYQQKLKPPVNKSISKMEGKKILEGTFVMPIQDFLATAEPAIDAETAVLHQKGGLNQYIPLNKLESALLLFAKEGRPIREDGPVHIYFQDGSNKDTPITGVEKIEIR